MSDNDHFHYASDIHGGAEQHHRHHDLEREDENAQRDIRRLQEDVRELRSLLDVALDRIRVLEGPAPEERAEHRRRAEEPDEEPNPGDYDPGPECDDEGGMSEYRHLTATEAGQ